MLACFYGPLYIITAYVRHFTGSRFTSINGSEGCNYEICELKNIDFKMPNLCLPLLMIILLLLVVNCVDRHALKTPERVALIWEKDEPGQTENVTFR